MREGRRRLIAAVLFSFCTAVSASGEPKAAADRVEVTVSGTLRMGVMAIGAETTGVTIAADGMTFELELTPRQVEAARKLDGRKATVKGTLELREGVEIRRRAIIKVSRVASG
jgi:hypothetical protein